jgi:outer membrane immunogenic protein
MKKLLVGIAGAVLGMMTAANAADFPVKAGPYTPMVQASNWTGVYIGGFAGGSWVNADYCVAFAGCNSVDPSGFVGGAYVGYDYELPNRFVIGARVSVPLGSVSESAAVTLPFIFGDTFDGKMQWAVAANGILGYDMGPWMPYAGVGVIFAKNKVDLTAPIGKFSDEEMHTGLNVLVGVKYALARNWAVGIQYNHSEFQNATYTFGPGLSAATISFSQNSLVGTVEYRF